VGIMTANKTEVGKSTLWEYWFGIHRTLYGDRVYRLW
jgi:hypothetical protein